MDCWVIYIGKIITYNDVKKCVEIDNKHSGCKLLSKKYVSAKDNLLFLCKCGNQFYTTFWQFKSNGKQQCNKCGHENGAKKQRLSYAYVKNFIEKESGSNCKLLSDKYVNNSTKLHIQCGCGNIFKMAFSKFKDRINSRRCEVCRGKISWNTDKVINFVAENSGCELISEEYIRHNKKLKFLCGCGNQFQTTWTIFLNNNKRHCDECGSKNRASFFTTPKEVFLHELYEVHGNEYDIVGNYINKNTKVATKHNACGFEWDVEPRNLVGNAGKKPTGCPECQSSRGELSIANFLAKNNIKYRSEYWLEDCRSIYPLPFDFAIFDDSESLKMLIEYDGEHHYMPVNFGGCTDQEAEKRHIRTKKHDIVKNQYCRDNNIPLLRIPYWEFDNIEQILDEILINYKKGV